MQQQPGKGWHDQRPWRQQQPGLCYVCHQKTFLGKNQCQNKDCTINTHKPMQRMTPDIEKLVAFVEQIKGEAEAELHEEAAAKKRKRGDDNGDGCKADGGVKIGEEKDNGC